MTASNQLSSPVADKTAHAIHAASALTFTTGIASKFWLEIISIPAGNNNRLWLLVGGTWAQLANAPQATQMSVQNAFNNGSNLQVAVWYDSNNAIIGLVVRTP